MALLRDRHHHIDTDDTADGDHDITAVAPAAPAAVSEERADRDRDTDRVVVRRNSLGQTLRTVIATVCLLAIVAFMALNTDDVRVDVAVDTYDVPLWGAVGGAALVGALMGWMLGWRRCRRPHTD